MELMMGSKSETEWNENCDKVKAHFGGYPDFWYALVVLGGALEFAKETHGW